MIPRNLALVREKIRLSARQARREPDEITLVCVAKGRSLEEVREAISCGAGDIGENRVQEAKERHASLGAAGARWHMVGHLQTNKAKDAVRMFDLIHSVDSYALALEIDKQAARISKVQDILIEVNTSGETAKYGIPRENVLGLVKDIISLKNIRLSGLMTMAPVVNDQEHARPFFRRLRELQGEVNVFLSTLSYKPSTILSMGMSQDYEVAIREGATMVRIGTAIFGENE